MSRINETASTVSEILLHRGLSSTISPHDSASGWRDDNASLTNPDGLMVEAGGQSYLCAEIADTPALREVIEDGGYAITERFRRGMRGLAQIRSGTNLYPTILLDFPPLGLDENAIGYACEIIESGLNAFVIVRRPHESMDSFMGRVPGLFSMPLETCRQPNWQGRISIEGEGRLPEVNLEFDEAPGMAILYGGNSSGKTRAVSMLKETGLGDSISMPSGRGFPECDDELMRPYRRAIGYGLPDGSLRMPIQYEGQGTLYLDRVVSAIIHARREGEPGSWPGLVLDTPFSGISDLYRYKLAEVIARTAVDRQMLVTCRNADDAGFLKNLTMAHGGAAGMGHLDFSGCTVNVHMERSPEPKSTMSTPKI